MIILPFGYALRRNVTDSFHRRWKYQVLPIGAGGISYFSCLADLRKWIRDVNMIRSF